MKFLKSCLMLSCIGGTVLFAGGCEVLKDAWEESMSEKSSGSLFGEDYKPKYVFALYAEVKYPRGLKNLEREITTFEGRRLWINTNQFLSSRHVLEIRRLPRADVPNAYDLGLKLNDTGVRIWTMLAQQFAREPIVMLIDNYYQCSFKPQPLPDEEARWVVIHYPFDEVTAKGMEKFAVRNFKHFNPPGAERQLGK